MRGNVIFALLLAPALALAAWQEVPTDQVILKDGHDFYSIGDGTDTLEAGLEEMDVVISQHIVTAEADIDALQDDVADLQAATPSAYLDGFHATYSNSTKVILGPGSGFCGTSFFYRNTDYIVSCNPIPATGTNFLYVYVDHSGTTYPDDPDFYASTNAPTKTRSTSQVGWYSGDDRCLSAVMATNGAVAEFSRVRGDYIPYVWFHLLNGGDPTGNYEDPDVALADVTPVNASHALIWAASTYTGSRTFTAVTGEDGMTGGAASSTTAFLYSEAGWNGARDKLYDWLPLGDDRELGIGVHDDSDDDSVDVWYHGWRIDR